MCLSKYRILKTYIHNWSFFLRNFKDGHNRDADNRGKGYDPARIVCPDWILVVAISVSTVILPGANENQLKNGTNL